MKKEAKIFLILILIISYAEPSKTMHEICALASEKSRCHGKHPIQCGVLHCAISKTQCENFLNSSLMFRSFGKPKMYRSQMRNYDAYFGSIKKCNDNNYAIVNIINRIFHI